MAAVLHDTVEDTETTFEELEETFGLGVAGLVREVTDDKSLAKERRKELPVVHARPSSPRAKQLKIADKIANIHDIAASPPTGWSLQRRNEYLGWAERVVAGCRGVNSRLDEAFDASIIRARAALFEVP